MRVKRIVDANRYDAGSLGVHVYSIQMQALLMTIRVVCGFEASKD